MKFLTSRIVLASAILLLWIPSLAFAQSLLPGFNDPLQTPDRERPKQGSSLALSSMRALAVENEKDTLAKYSKNSESFEDIFDTVVEDAQQSLVVIRTKGLSKSPRASKHKIVLGTVVSDTGLVLTKASELKGTLFCEFASGETIPAELIGLDTENDLALLKTDATGLAPGNWVSGQDIKTGDWLATPLSHKGEIQVGVVSVKPREIKPSRPFIGIYMNDAKPTGVMVVNIQAKSPAEESGLKPDDIILKLDDQLVKDVADMRKKLEQYDPGDLLALSIQRGDSERRLKLTLAERDKVSSEHMRSNKQNSMGSRLSRRRKNFPLAFQHDTALQAPQCGGPIVNLDGEIVGVNIARAGRVSSLAIPASEVQPIVERLSTGEFSPAVVNAERIDRVVAEIEEAKRLSGELSKELSTLKESSESVDGTRRGMELAAEAIQKQLDDIIAKAKKQKKQLKDANNEVTRLERTMRELKKEQERLVTGLKY